MDKFRGLNIPVMAKRSWKWMLDEDLLCERDGDYCSDIDCCDCIYSVDNSEYRKEYYNKLFKKKGKEMSSGAVFNKVETPKYSDSEITENTSAHSLNTVQELIKSVCYDLADLLVEKNRKYGNSALDPVRVFSKANVLEQLKVRMDDKLSRIRNEQSDEDEDVIMDLAGYCVLYQVAKRMKHV